MVTIISDMLLRYVITPIITSPLDKGAGTDHEREQHVRF